MANPELYPLREHVRRTDCYVQHDTKMTILGSQVHVMLDDIHEYKTRAEAAEDALRSLASYVGNGGYNAPVVDATEFRLKIVAGIDTITSVEATRRKEVSLKYETACGTIRTMQAEREALMQRIHAQASERDAWKARAEEAERKRDEWCARWKDLDSRLAAAWVDDSDDNGGWTGG